MIMSETTDKVTLKILLEKAEGAANAAEKGSPLRALAFITKLTIARVIDIARTAKNRVDKADLEIEALRKQLEEMSAILGQIAEKVLATTPAASEETSTEDEGTIIDGADPKNADPPANGSSTPPMPKPPKLATVKPSGDAA